MIRVNDEARSREADVYNSQANCQLLLGVEDTGHVTIEHRLTNLLFLLFSSLFCPFVSYCFTSTVSSTQEPNCLNECAN